MFSTVCEYDRLPQLLVKSRREITEISDKVSGSKNLLIRKNETTWPSVGVMLSEENPKRKSPTCPHTGKCGQ